MTIEVVLSAHLTRFLTEGAEGPGEGDTGILTFEEPVTAGEILELWKVPQEEAAICTFNGQRIEVDEAIAEDGILRIFPSLIGG